MAKLNSAAVAKISKGTTELYEVNGTVQQVKVSELIITNTDTSGPVTVSAKIFKATSGTAITIIPNMNLLAVESKIISLSTFLTNGDKILIEANVDNAVDVMVSFIEV